MSTKSTTPIVTLEFPKSYNDLLMLAKAILAAMSANKTTFPSPTPPMTQLSTDVGAFDTAQAATLTKTKGTVATRNEARAVVVTDLKQLKGYVQLMVDASPEHALAIAESANMTLRKPPAHTKSDIAAKADVESGSVKVTVKATPGAGSNEWQFSTDGKTWTSAAPTTQATTTIPNLTPGVLTYFRQRPITPAGPGTWSQAVALIVT
jgi:hypothetical protein